MLATRWLIAALAAFSTVFPTISYAQVSPNCPFLGAVFPTPSDVLGRSTVVPLALSELRSTLQQSLTSGVLENTSTTFYLSVFSRDSKVFDFNYAAPSLNGSLTSGVLDENTVFRIGSVSKLFTVYTVLAEVGMNHMNDPVTKWIPELSSEDHKGNSNVVDNVNWDEITVGALASQMAGVNRDLTLQDLSLFYNATMAETIALPAVPTKDIPTCGTSNILPPCSRTVFFEQLKSLHPVISSFHTPIYSNIAYQLLSYVLEGMTNKSFSDSVQESLLQPLNLTRTTLEPPSTTENAIIPGDELVSWWNETTGDGSPFGGIFSTATDLVRLGQSILNSTIIAPALTRSWLRPVTHTADLSIAVGMPWEIHRLLLPLSPDSNNTRVVDLYTKNGALGSYASLFVISPDHDLGFVVLLASATTDVSGRDENMVVIGDLATDILVPAFEAAAREQANTNFAGTYTDPDTTMTLTVTVDDGLPGLGIHNWTRGDLDILKIYTFIMGIPYSLESSLRIYPMNLVGVGKARFRGVYEVLQNTTTTTSSSSGGGGVFTSGCLPWGGVGGIQYDNVGFDDFDFVVDGTGDASAIVPRVTGQTLFRVADAET